MKFFLLLPLLCTFAFAQSPEEGFREISPEQEKKIREREERKEVLRRKLEEKKKKAEEAKIAARKKAEEEKRIAEERKKKEDAEKLAISKKVEEEKKKAEEALAYRNWLISERDRKMKEEQERIKAEAAKKPGGDEKVIPAPEKHGAAEKKTSPEQTSVEKKFFSQSSGGSPSSGSETGEKGSPLISLCEKTPYAIAWEKEFRSLKGEDIRERGSRAGYPSITETKLQEFLCNCRFPEGVEFPSSLKVIGLGGYEGKYKGREARHSGMHPETDVTIKVNSREPVILAISVYEPVRWKIQGPVAGIVIIGYYRQTIDVEGKVPVLKSLMLADSVLKTGKFSLGNNLCKSSDDALILGPIRDTETIFHEKNDDPGNRDRKMLDDRSLLIFGKNLSSYSYNYTFPEFLEVIP